MFDRLHQLEPWLTVKVSGGVDDTKITAAIRSGQPPDVAISSNMDQIPNLCSSGAWQDLPSAVQFTQCKEIDDTVAQATGP